MLAVVSKHLTGGDTRSVRHGDGGEYMRCCLNMKILLIVQTWRTFIAFTRKKTEIVAREKSLNQGVNVGLWECHGNDQRLAGLALDR